MSVPTAPHDYVGDQPSPKPKRAERGIFHKTLQVLASLRVTVVLFSLSMVLVFFGTVAMMQYSIEDTMKHYFRSWYAFIELRTISDFGSVFFPYLFSRDHPIPGKLPFPGGYVIGWAMFINLLAAHAVRFKLTWKRSGIFLLHAGVIVLLAGEFLTGQFAVETRMVIKEGESSHYVFHLGQYELAFVDPSNPDYDNVVVLPSDTILDAGKAKWVSDPDLPADVQLVKFYPNARLRALKPGETAVATQGIGLGSALDEQPRSKGTDGGEIEQPAIYLAFRDKAGNDLGTYLFSTNLERGQDVTIDGKKYKVAFRFKREYRPFEVRCDEAVHDVYEGTDTPKDFASVVRVEDPQAGEYGPVRIWMNHPLYYKGETFYQSGMFTDPDTGVKTTTLQVVVNHAWTFPYIACSMVGLGIAFHFLLRLLTFLNKRKVLVAKAQPSKATIILPQGGSNSLRLFGKYFPLGIASLGALMFVGRAIPPSPSDSEFNFYGFGSIPVQHGGRIQPIDSVARNSLMVISGKQEFVDGDDKGRTYSATEWLLVLWSDGERADKFRIFRVEELQVLGMMNLPQRPGSFRYSFAEMEPKLPELEARASDAGRKAKEQRTRFEEKLMELAHHLEVYRALQFRKNPGLIPTDPYGGKWLSYGDVVETEAPSFFERAEFQVREELGEQLKKDPGMMSDLVREHLGGVDKLEEALKQFGGRDQLLKAIIDAEVRNRRAPVARANFLKMLPTKYPLISDLDAILADYKAGNKTAFNSGVVNFQEKYIAKIPDSIVARVRLEAWMNHVDPFLFCFVLYIGVAILAAFSWLYWQAPLRNAAFWLACVTLVAHTAALVARMYIGNRPPVTNLYSSAVFIGWGGLALCLFLERVYKLGVGSFVGGLLGFATMYIARTLAASGDTLEMLQAVLDTNFWLATHVVCVTLGYVATLVTGVTAAVYIIGGVFSTGMKGNDGKQVAGMIYGTACFATLLSFVGTVLGGIWADQSWGRFWGWDPKENGAVLIVIWNALILHARWCGLAKVRGVAVLAVIGVMWTAWSWFGTNQLGIGLHSYGFDNTLILTCVLTWLGASLIAALGMVPLKYWASFSPTLGGKT